MTLADADRDPPRIRRLDAAQYEALLDAAANEFAEHGFDGASIKAIADAAGMTKPKIFYYFDGKEDLYAEVLDRVLGELLVPADGSSEPDSVERFWSDFQQRVIRVCQLAGKNARNVALAKSLYSRGGSAPSYVRLLARIRGIISGWLQLGRSLGAVRTDLSIELLSNLTIGALLQVDRAFVEAGKWGKDRPADSGREDTVVVANGLIRLAKDALKQSVPDSLEADMNYASENTPTTVDGYVQVSEMEPKRITLHNGRTTDAALRINTDGFQLIETPARFDLNVTDDQVRAAYPAIEQSLMAITGARKALVFDHTVRRTGASAGERSPIHMVHADYARGAGERRLSELLPADEARIWKDGGFMIANLWQSINGVVHSSPLAFIDIRTVEEGDFVAVTVNYGQRQGQIGYYRFNPAHKWFWLPFLQPSEALLFKTYEPVAGLQHWSCPHSAFRSPIEPPEFNGRRSSIEFRVALAFEGTKAR